MSYCPLCHTIPIKINEFKAFFDIVGIFYWINCTNWNAWVLAAKSIKKMHNSSVGCKSAALDAPGQ